MAETSEKTAVVEQPKPAYERTLELIETGETIYTRLSPFERVELIETVISHDIAGIDHQQVVEIDGTQQGRLLAAVINGKAWQKFENFSLSDQLVEFTADAALIGDGVHSASQNHRPGVRSQAKVLAVRARQALDRHLQPR